MSFKNNSVMNAITPTDRPNSVPNGCVIEVFGGVWVLSRCFLDFSDGVGAFCHSTESDLLLFLLNMHVSSYSLVM